MTDAADLTDTQRESVTKLLDRFEHVFRPTSPSMSRTPLTKHDIDTGDHSPIKMRTRRMPQAQHDIAKKEIDKMLEKGVIQESDSPWAAPIVLVSKKDGSTRFCVDYRQLNNITRKDSYPLPNIDETLDSLSGAQYFCALDLASGYWQVPLTDSAKEKTAFSTKFGLYQFNVMPFGLCNAPATFERLMERVLKGHIGNRCLVYLDDIVIYGRTFQETLDNLDEVLTRLQSAGLQCKPAKCSLFRRELMYLGFIISGKSIRPDPSKISAVKKWPVPCNINDVRSFLGFANYHRRFIQDFARIANPLTQLTRKNRQFVWSTECQQAFESLKNLPSDRPCPQPPDPPSPVHTRHRR